MTTILQLPVTALRPHPGNPRRDLGDLVELADSIRAHGVRQALVVVPYCEHRKPSPDCVIRVKTNDGTTWCSAHQHAGVLRVVIGHRRLAAARMAGLTDVPAVIDDRLTEADQIELMLVENVQRADLSPVEEATGYQALLDLAIPKTQIARRTGRARSTIDARLKLLILPEPAREKVHARQATLEDAAVVAEIAEQAPDLAEGLVESLGTLSLAWRARYARETIAARAKVAGLVAELEGQGASSWTPPAADDNDMTGPDGFDYVWHWAPPTSKDVSYPGDLTGWLYDAHEDSVWLYRPEAKPTTKETQREEALRREHAERIARGDKLRADGDRSYVRRDEFVRTLIARSRWSAEDTEAIGYELAHAAATRTFMQHPSPVLFGLRLEAGWEEGLAAFPWQAIAIAVLHADAGQVCGYWTGTAGIKGQGAAARVQACYRLLECLGYVMADDERHYIYGEQAEGADAAEAVA